MPRAAVPSPASGSGAAWAGWCVVCGVWCVGGAAPTLPGVKRHQEPLLPLVASIARLGAASGRARPGRFPSAFRGSPLAVQGKRRSAPSHPTEAPGHQLGRVRCRPAGPRQPDGVVSPEAVAVDRRPRTGRARQPCSAALAVATALTLRAVFRLALRQTEGLIGSVVKLLGLDLPVPDHSTLSRWAETLEVRGRERGARPCICWWTARGSSSAA